MPIMFYVLLKHFYVFHACFVCSLLAVCEEQQRGRQRLVQVGVKQGGNKVCVCLSVSLFVGPCSFVVAVEMLVSDSW